MLEVRTSCRRSARTLDTDGRSDAAVTKSSELDADPVHQQSRAASTSVDSKRSARRRSADGLRTIDVVIVALANLGGATQAVDIEDVAIEAHRLVPHRFGWRRHPEQVDLAGVRDGLSDARKPENGSLVVGERKQGWILTPAGVSVAGQLRELVQGGSDDGRVRLDVSVRAAERLRVLRSRALQKTDAGRIDDVTAQEVRELLRIDPYVSESKYRQRLSIVVNAFADEPAIRSTIEELERRLREGGLSR